MLCLNVIAIAIITIRDPVVFMDEQLNLSFLQTLKTSGLDYFTLKYRTFIRIFI